MSDEIETPWAGEFIEVRRQGRWEWAARRGDVHAAVILAVHDGRLILVEQERVPLGRRSLELPAGLVGDETAGESVERAATRELEEETGYSPERVEALGAFASSPGMTSETFTLIRATGLTRVGAGGGVGNEGITVHHVPVAEVAAFVAAKRAEGVSIDAKLLLVLGAGIMPAGE